MHIMICSVYLSQLYFRLILDKTRPEMIDYVCVRDSRFKVTHTLSIKLVGTAFLMALVGFFIVGILFKQYIKFKTLQNLKI